MNVQGFKPVDAMGTWSIFCSLSLSRFFTLVECNQNRLRNNAYQLILEKDGVKYRTYICYASRDYVIAGYQPEDADLLICWQHNWKDCGLQVIEVSDMTYSGLDDYVTMVEQRNQELSMKLERVELLCRRLKYQT